MIVIFIFFAIVLAITTALCLLSIAHVKCPRCGADMEYLGDDDDFAVYNSLPKQLKHHYYKCPCCGETKII